MLTRYALCPECGKQMQYIDRLEAFDCGPELEGGHGFWNSDLKSLEWGYIVKGKMVPHNLVDKMRKEALL